jgi:hypothetical protein
VVAASASEGSVGSNSIGQGPVRLQRHMRYEGLISELIWTKDRKELADRTAINCLRRANRVNKKGKVEEN